MKTLPSPYFVSILLCYALSNTTLFAQQCNIPLFGQTYSIGQGKINLAAMRLDVNNTYVAVGGADQLNSANTDPCIIKFDNLGKIIWAKRVSIDPNTGFLNNMKTTTDGGYIAVGSINGQPAIIKFSSTGTVQWSQISNDGSGQRGNFGDHFRSVIQTRTGEYVASGSIGLNDITYVTKFSAAGAVLWTRQIGSSSSDWSVGLDEFTDGNLIVASNTTSTTNTYLMKLSTADGSTLWQKQYSSGAPNACCDHSFDEITKAADGNFLVVGNWASGISLVQKVDNNGNIVWAKTIENSTKAFRSTHSTSTPDGGYIVSQFDYNNQLQRTIVKFDAALNVQWVKNIGGGGGDPFIKGVLPLTDGSYVMLANENNNFFIKKTDAAANTCDPMETGTVTTRTVQVQVSDGSFGNTAGGSFSQQTWVANPLSISIVSRCICPITCNGCFKNDSVKIAGIDTLCYNTNFTYKLTGYQCSQFKTTWSILGTGINIVSRTDTTLTVRFSQGTTARLTAVIQDSCNTNTITAKTSIIGAPPILELGADINICQTGSYPIKAGRGFKSYLWKNGSVDSTFTATGVGTYWVRVVDSCGDVQSDTLRINQIAPPLFNIVPDSLRICEGQNVAVTAPTGFTKYRWLPSLGINDTTQQRVILTPSVSTKYFCTVSTNFGCTNMDSILVQVTPLTVKNIDGEVCSLKPLKLGDSTFTKPGNYIVTLKGTSGACDTILKLRLSLSRSNDCNCPIFIPNAFSPFTTPKVNDFFYPFGGECAKNVVIMQIFDRWGGLVFSKTNFLLNDESLGWDGSFQGKQLPPDVYTYWTDILLFDGTVQRLVGDVTIMR
jgi:gliding motility-associated-like protein